MNFAFYEQEKLTLFTQLNERRAEIQSKNQELISNLMLKYTHDSDIVYAAFSHNIKDLSAINRGLMSLHESGLRFVYKTLLHTEDPLPTQTIGFLLSLDRPDAIQILFAQLKKGSDSIIASQLQLSYISQIPLAKELYDKSLFIFGVGIHF